MKKNTLLSAIVAGATLLFASCEEKGPPINFSNTKAVDSTYVGTKEAPQQKRVLIEEFTGVTCSNCPSGHKIIASVIDQYPERVIALGLHDNVSPQAKPSSHNKFDFRLQAATDLGNNIFGGVANLPSAGIDRAKFNGNILIDQRTLWPNYVADRLALSTPVNMYINSTFNETAREATIKVKTAFTQSVSKKLVLTVVVVENNIVDAQDSLTYIAENYVHKHVVRDILTPVTGASFLNDLATKEEGRVYERTFVYPINAAWKPENCRVVAFVSKAEPDDKEIVQAVEAALKP